MHYKNTLVDFPNFRKEYAGVGNPRFVSDIVNLSESLMTAMDAIFGLGDLDFAIIAGFEYDAGGSPQYAPGIIYLAGSFYYTSGCNSGIQLRADPTDGVPKVFEDSTTHNIYTNNYLTTATPPIQATDSPVLSGNMDAYRLNITKLKEFVTTYYATLADLALSTGGLRTKVLAINNWDMDTDYQKAIAHGLSATEWKTICNISAMILNDAANRSYPLNHATQDSGGVVYVGGTIYYASATNVYLVRTQSGVFDSTDFDTATGLRGYLTISYIPD